MNRFTKLMNIPPKHLTHFGVQTYLTLLATLTKYLDIAIVKILQTEISYLSKTDTRIQQQE